MTKPYLIILSTCPDQESAEKLARHLINGKIAACINILPGLTSIYSWKGSIETSREHLLIIKTRNENYPAVEQNILANHPYELPEIIAVPIEHGSPAYLQWINSCLS